MAADVSYRRGNAREALLARAALLLRERGAGALSLRELARDLGMSHAAPARHFSDRQDLLDALAVEGFTRLADRVRDVARSADDPFRQALLIARAYVDFAVSESHLVEVMYQHKTRGDQSAITQSAEAAFVPLLSVFRRGEELGLVAAGSGERSATLLIAALQGLAVLTNCGVIAADDVAGLVDDTVPRYIGNGPISARPSLPPSRAARA